MIRKFLNPILAALLFAPSVVLHAAEKPAAMLRSGELAIRQAWSQEQDFPRLYLVSVPANPDARKLQVLIFLHGNGGDAQGAMNAFRKQYPAMTAHYATVFPEGYLKSWNISAERSKADDRSFIEAIVETIAACDNVQPDDFTIMGNSNGAALANQLAIEGRLPNIRNYVTAVSPLNALQHDGRNFKAKGDDNEYQAVATPRTGVRILNISGTDDHLIPYHGGPSPVIPAKNGKLGFVAAEESIFLWAKAMGYQGEKLKGPIRTTPKVEFFDYLDGAILHCKVLGEGHGAARAVEEATLLRFLEAAARIKNEPSPPASGAQP
jgi:polyhydroxybutyrate depolymerase